MRDEKIWRGLADKLSQPLKDGYYTAVAAEVGFLHEGEARWHWEETADATVETPLVFDLASTSKALMTAPLVWERAQTCTLSLDKSLGEFFPALARWHQPLPAYLLALPVRELLTHTSGLPAWRNFWMGTLYPETPLTKDLEDIFSHGATVFGRYPEASPLLGAKQDLYSDLGFILLGLGLMAEAMTPLSLQFATLKASSSVFSHTTTVYLEHVNQLAAAGIKAQVVPSAWCALRERWLRGEIHDENAASFGGEAGHAGLFGSCLGVGAWLRYLWHHYGGQVGLAVPGSKEKTWPGWRHGDDQASSLFGHGRARGHWGFTGTGFWVDPASSAYAILLTNRVISGRVTPRIKEIRRSFFSQAAQVLSLKP